MNPHYNQQQPYYNYQQQIPGPPQPQWQSQTPQSPGGWADPRFQSMSQQRPQSPQYGQNNFAPMPGPPSQYHPPPPPPPPPVPGSPYDTSAWGVKYNQAPFNQYHQEPQQTYQPEHKPALPPRPVSSMSHNSHHSLGSQHQHQHHASVGDYQQTPTQYQSQGSWNVPFGQAQQSMPPAPPPRPAAYTSPAPYGQPAPIPEHYSHHAPTHHYDPQTPAQPSWQQNQPHQPASSSASIWSHSEEGPVSPLEDDRRRQSLVSRPQTSSTLFVEAEPPSQNLELPKPIRTSTLPASGTQLTSTAFSALAGPSDWQHYESPSQHVTIEEHEEPAVMSEPQIITASPLQTKNSIKRKSIERIRPSPKPAVSQPQAQLATPFIAHDEAQTMSVSQPSTRLPSPRNQGLERHDSAQSGVSSISGIGRSETIDNVIQAWSTPMKVDSSVQTSSPPSRSPSSRERVSVIHKVPMVNREAQTDFKPLVETKIETRIETKEVEKDPYADIQNQYKATLNRFAEMLRQEAVAGTDEDKFKVFQGFVIRELRLRSVLYGVETLSQETPLKTEQKREPVTTPMKAPMPVPAESKPQPQTPTKPINQTTVSPQVQYAEPHRSLSIDTKTPVIPNGKDDAFVMVDANGDDGDYSPGGRPRIKPLRIKSPAVTENARRFSIERKPISSTPTNTISGRISPGLNAPMTLDDYVMPDQPSSPSANAPIVVGPEDVLTGSDQAQLTGPLNFQPARPLYQPFRYGEGSEDQPPAVHIQGPPAESFAALRQTSAVESGRTLVHDMPPSNASVAPSRGQSKTPASGRREHEEAFIGLIRAKSMAIRKNANASPRPDSPAVLRAGTPANRSSAPPAPVSPLVKSVQSLRFLVPKTVPPQAGPKSPSHPKLEPIISFVQNVSDDFGYIHARVIEWDKSNRQIRFKQETERQTRQSQNEEHIDQLFNDNEIGYADIAELEKDFKLEEASRKYKEDQDEFESFRRGVFDFVLEKIDGELRDLTKHQTHAIDMLDLESTTAAKQVQNALLQPSGTSSSPANPSVTAIMQALLLIHEKLEIRHLKIAEASFERERRRKRLELSILYTNNDKAGIRKLEGEFAKAEKVQILEESRKKTERANKLLDSFDRAVVRGLAENQGVSDDVLSKLQLLRDLIMGSEENGPAGLARDELLYGPDGIRELVDRASAMVEYIHADSKVLVQLLDKADGLSNNADFELYMSEAKLADASPEKYQKLKSEKDAEDVNVSEELSNRLSGIARVPGEISVLVRDVKDKIGGDSGHEERIGKALEAARKRNTGLAG